MRVSEVPYQQRKNLTQNLKMSHSLSASDIARMLGVSRFRAAVWARAGRFGPPLRIEGRRRPRYSLAEIERRYGAWIAHDQLEQARRECRDA
jgi:hypothetical protein